MTDSMKLVLSTYKPGYFQTNSKLRKLKQFNKKDDNTLPTNYRPISVLPTVSKVFEKVMFDQIYAYFSDNNLFFTS